MSEQDAALEALIAALQLQNLSESGEPSVQDDEEDDDEEEYDDKDQPRTTKQTKSEKKSRKAIRKLNLQRIHNVSRVTLKKNENVIVAISKPDVYKHPTHDTYIVFGEAKLSKRSQTQAGEQSDVADENPEPEPPAVAEENVEIDEDDETGLDPRDLDLILSQGTATRRQAIKALRAADGDVVTAIMELNG